MNATVTETLINSRVIDFEIAGKEDLLVDQIVEVDAPDDSLLLTIIDFCMVLLVYLVPVAAFGYLVAPVVVRLLRMPVPG